MSALVAFASKAAKLESGAWARIADRCKVLDSLNVGGFVARTQLYWQSLDVKIGAHDQPLVGALMATLGGVAGLLVEVGARITASAAVSFEPVRRDAYSGPLSSIQLDELDGFLAVNRIAQGYQEEHPGTAAALRAIGLGLMIPAPVRGPQFDDIYAPFEPEIPLSSLTAHPIGDA